VNKGDGKFFFEVSILSKYYSTPIKALKKMEIHLLGLFFFLYSNYYAISMANA
jgi:hypothetical protein